MVNCKVTHLRGTNKRKFFLQEKKITFYNTEISERISQIQYSFKTSKGKKLNEKIRKHLSPPNHLRSEVMQIFTEYILKHDNQTEVKKNQRCKVKESFRILQTIFTAVFKTNL